MEKVRRLRAMGSLCRQQAAYNSMNKWKLLAEAEYWEHLAQLELSSYFQECSVSSNEIAPPQVVLTDTNDARLNDAQCAFTDDWATCPDPSPGDYKTCSVKRLPWRVLPRILKPLTIPAPYSA